MPVTKTRGIDDTVKGTIKDLFSLGVTGAMNIIYALRDRKIDQAKIPTRRQLYNFLYEYKQEL